MKYVKSIILLLVMLTAQGAHGQKYDFSEINNMPRTKERFEIMDLLHSHTVGIEILLEALLVDTGSATENRLNNIEIAMIATYSDGFLAEDVEDLIQRAIKSKPHFITDVSESEYYIWAVQSIYWYMSTYWEEEDSREGESMSSRINRYISSLPSIVTDAERKELRAALNEYNLYFTERERRYSSQGK